MKVIKIEKEKIYEKEIENTLESMQKEVEGFIEIVNLTDDYVLICNEEGRIKNLPYTLTIWIDRFNQKYQTDLYGNLIICAVNGEEFDSLTEEEISYLMNSYYFTQKRILDVFNDD